MNNQWIKISEALYEIYKKENIIEFFDKDEEYLRNSFYTIEKLWEEQFNKIDTIKVILISEAPLFGDDEKYIYNKIAAPSAFFHFNDIMAFPTWNDEITKPKLIQEQKKLMIKEFYKNGLLVLDIFPFAFNEKDTKLNYRNINKKLYKELLELTKENYMMPKLKNCMLKVTEDTKFVYRYKRLYEKTGYYFDSLLNELSLDVVYQTDTINGENMSLDRNKLKILLQS